jgi:serine/threonine protein kinase
LPLKISVASKVIPKRKLKDAFHKKKLEFEILLHKKLQHSHIVKQHHFFEDNENLFIMPEYGKYGTIYG